MNYNSYNQVKYNLNPLPLMFLSFEFIKAITFEKPRSTSVFKWIEHESKPILLGYPKKL
jgi:hypothetical protein